MPCVALPLAPSILQVQLSKLTNDFQTLTDDMRKRFSVDGRSVLDEIYGSSPIASTFLSPQKGFHPPGSHSAGGAGRGAAGGRYSGRHNSGAAGGGPGGSGYPPPFPGAEFGTSPGRDLSLLSTSAPVRGSSPIAINQHRSKAVAGIAGIVGASDRGVGGSSSSSLGAPRGAAVPTVGSPGVPQSPSSSVAAAAGSTLGPSSVLSSEGNGSIPGSVDSTSGAAALAALAAAGGSNGGSLQQRAAAAAAAAAAAGGFSGGSTGGGSHASGKGVNGLLGQQLRNSSRAGSNNSLQGMDGTGVVAAEQPSRLSGPGVEGWDPASLAVLRRLQEEMGVVAEGFKRHSGTAATWSAI